MRWVNLHKMDACIGELMAVARADTYFRVEQKGIFSSSKFRWFLKTSVWLDESRRLCNAHTHTPCHPGPYHSHAHTHAALPHTHTHTCGINHLRIRQGMQSRAATAASSMAFERSSEVRVRMCAHACARKVEIFPPLVCGVESPWL
jgi:hypothetical protein